MENRITISICDEEYTFVAEEAPSYMQKVGSYVNDKMSELLDAAKVGRTDAAVLTAVNITDELFKEREAGDALRRQVKQYLDEATDGLDIDNRKLVADTIRSVRDGRSIIVIAHDFSFASDVADTLIFLKDGRFAEVVESARGEEIEQIYKKLYHGEVRTDA